MKQAATILLSLLFFNTLGQNNKNRFAFEEFSDIKVIKGNSSIKNPWTGGINYANMNTMDLNGDGRQDLVVFDKSGPRVTTFIDKNSSGVADFIYAPEYRMNFPIGRNIGFEEDWMLLRDFDCDGKKDLFVGISSYVKVYKNVSIGNQIEFQKAHSSEYLKVLDSSSSVILYIIQTDVPGIIDLDNDGDLDIINFSSSGSSVEWIENKQSCGLNFEVKERCWGRFKESGVSNTMKLDTCDPATGKYYKTLHLGGTLLPLDLNGDGIKDILVGDISYNSITALYNTGTTNDAFMTSQQTNYPSGNHPVSEYEFPACFYEDVDGDAVKDLIISPNQIEFSGSKNYRSVAFYKNTGSNTIPNFNFVQDNFLQEHQLDFGEGAVPRFVDLNGDSLQDLIISNAGYFSSSGLHPTFTYLENTGTKSSPSFNVIDTNFLNIGSFNFGDIAVPTFGDLDGDNDLDMIIGDSDGHLNLFTNTGSTSNPIFSLTTANIPGIDVGNSAAPFLYDINQDGSLDLLIGNERGFVYYYSNTSSTSPLFIFESNFFGGINVSHPHSFGFSVPYAFKVNGDIHIMVSSGTGVFQYDSLSQIINRPAIIYSTIGMDSIESGNLNESPFGVNKFVGRNQMLYTAAELKAQGLTHGFIKNIAFDITRSMEDIIDKGINIKMKNTSATNLSTLETKLTLVSKEDQRVKLDSSSWNSIPLKNPFLWDGISNLVVEICFSGNTFRQPLIKLKMSNTSFISNAWGDVASNNTFSTQGCSLPLLGSSSKRPNIRFGLTPTLVNTDSFLKDGIRNAAAFYDLDDDGYIDAVVGNHAGGINYYSGKKYDIGIEEYQHDTSQKLNVFPNPGNNLFYVKTENLSSNAMVFVYDLTGKLITTKSVDSHLTSVNLQHQPNGMYFFVLQGSSILLTQKVIKH